MGLITVEVFVEDLPVTPTLMWSGIPLFDVGDGIRLVDYCKIIILQFLVLRVLKSRETREFQTWIVLSTFPRH